MKRVDSYFLLAPLALILAVAGVVCSCDKDAREVKGAAISFGLAESDFIPAEGFPESSSIPKVKTKGTVITSNNVNTTDFEVWAFKDGSMYMGKSYSKSSDDGVRITWSETAGTGAGPLSQNGYWSYHNADELALWPGDGSQLTFIALGPSHDKSQEHSETKSEIKNITVSSTEITFEYQVSSDFNKQWDVMYASAAANSGNVPLTFKHALSQVSFTASVDEGLGVEISYMTLYNIGNGKKYTISLDKNANAEVTNVSEDNTNTSYKVYTLKTQKDGTNRPDTKLDVTIDGSSSSSEATTLGEPLLLAPQTLTESNVTAGTEVKSTESSSLKDAAGSYMGIVCSVKNKATEEYLHGSSSGHVNLYFPLSGTWEAGKKYTYSLSFSAPTEPAT